MLYPPFKNLHSRVSLSFHPSALRFHSLPRAILNQFSSNLAFNRVYIRKECLGIADGLISTNNYRVMALD